MKPPPHRGVPNEEPPQLAQGRDRAAKDLVLPRKLLAPAALLALALPAGLAAQTVADTRVSRGPPGIAGEVVDRETGEPLEGVAVELHAMGEAVGMLPISARTLTDAAGRFAVAALDDGRYRITIDRLGYRPITDSIDFRSDVGLRIEVQFVLEAVELDPLFVVVDARSSYLEATGFYDRQRHGIGHFLTREEIQARRPSEVSDVFRPMAGVRLSANEGLGSQGILLMRGGCAPDIYVDGMRTVGPYPIDALVQPLDVQAIEVYTGSELPTGFDTSTCGAVVIWTHVPSPGGPPNQSGWRRLLVAAGFAGIAYLLVR